MAFLASEFECDFLFERRAPSSVETGKATQLRKLLFFVNEICAQKNKKRAHVFAALFWRLCNTLASCMRLTKTRSRQAAERAFAAESRAAAEARALAASLARACVGRAARVICQQDVAFIIASRCVCCCIRTALLQCTSRAALQRKRRTNCQTRQQAASFAPRQVASDLWVDSELSGTQTNANCGANCKRAMQSASLLHSCA